MTPIGAYVAGVVTFVAGAWLGWIARNSMGTAKGEASVSLSGRRRGGWSEPAVGSDPDWEE